jgi:hypothetical protein
VLIALSLTCVPAIAACRKNDDAAPVDGEGTKKKPKPDPKAKVWESKFDQGSSCPDRTFCSTAPEIVEANDVKSTFKECGESAKIPESIGKEEGFTGKTAFINNYATKEERKSEPAACCYTFKTGPCGKGRPLRDGDAFVIATEVVGDGWSALDLPEVDDALEAARLEHGSVAAFAMLSLELMALGAPPELVADAHRAALDEIRHAQIFWSMSGGYAPGPMTIPTRTLDVDRMIVETVIDGCVGESLGAEMLRQKAERTPHLAHVYREMAADEERHADLAFRVLTFLVGNDVRRARLAERALDDAQRKSWTDVYDVPRMVITVA